MVFRVKETLRESESGKGLLAKFDIPKFVPCQGSYGVEITEVETWVPKSRVADDGWIDEEWLSWKLKSMLEQKSNGGRSENKGNDGEE